MVEGGRGVCWADQKEEILKEESTVTLNGGVVMSPLAESNVHLDVPPSSVLCHPQTTTVAEPIAPTNMDETVVLQSTGLDVTFDMNSAPAESTYISIKVILRNYEPYCATVCSFTFPLTKFFYVLIVINVFSGWTLFYATDRPSYECPFSVNNFTKCGLF